MATVSEAIALWRGVDVQAMAEDSIIANSDALVDIQSQQMRLGLNSQGQKIGWYRSERYAVFKRDWGSIAPFRVPDLFLHGDFQGGLTVKYDGEKLVFTSTDVKTPKLVDMYGEEIFGLDDDSAEMLKEEVFTPDMARRIRKVVKL